MQTQPPPCMTGSPEKRQLYGDEVYYREAFASACEVWKHGSEHQIVRHSAVLIKPESIVGRLVGAIVDSITRHSFRIVAWHPLFVDRLMSRALWRFQFNVATLERLAIVDRLIQASRCLYLILGDANEGDGGPISERIRSWKGPAAPALRKPNQLRYELGTRSHLINYIHAPDEPADFVRELGILFDRAGVRDILQDATSGIDRQQEVLAVTEELYGEYGMHDLCLTQSIRRIVHEVSLTASATQLREFEACADALLQDTPGVWGEFMGIVARSGVRLPLWDRILVEAAFADLSIPGRQKLL